MSIQKFTHVIISGTTTTVQILFKIGPVGAYPQVGEV